MQPWLARQRVQSPTIHGWCATQSIDDVAPLMTPEITQRSEALFDEAERVADSPKVLARVKHARLSLEYVTVMRRVKSATASEDAEERAATLAALKDFAARCAADGIAQWREGEPLDATVARLAERLAAEGVALQGSGGPRIQAQTGAGAPPGQCGAPGRCPG